MGPGCVKPEMPARPATLDAEQALICFLQHPVLAQPIRITHRQLPQLRRRRAVDGVARTRRFCQLEVTERDLLCGGVMLQHC